MFQTTTNQITKQAYISKSSSPNFAYGVKAQFTSGIVKNSPEDLMSLNMFSSFTVSKIKASLSVIPCLNSTRHHHFNRIIKIFAIQLMQRTKASIVHQNTQNTLPVSDHVLSKLYHGQSPLKVNEGLTQSVLLQIEHALGFLQ